MASRGAHTTGSKRPHAHTHIPGGSAALWDVDTKLRLVRRAAEAPRSVPWVQDGPVGCAVSTTPPMGTPPPPPPPSLLRLERGGVRGTPKPAPPPTHDDAVDGVAEDRPSKDVTLRDRALPLPGTRGVDRRDFKKDSWFGLSCRDSKATTTMHSVWLRRAKHVGATTNQHKMEGCVCANDGDGGGRELTSHVQRELGVCNTGK